MSLLRPDAPIFLPASLTSSLLAPRSPPEPTHDVTDRGDALDAAHRRHDEDERDHHHNSKGDGRSALNSMSSVLVGGATTLLSSPSHAGQEGISTRRSRGHRHRRPPPRSHHQHQGTTPEDDHRPQRRTFHPAHPAPTTTRARHEDDEVAPPQDDNTTPQKIQGDDRSAVYQKAGRSHSYRRRTGRVARAGGRPPARCSTSELSPPGRTDHGYKMYHEKDGVNVSPTNDEHVFNAHEEPPFHGSNQPRPTTARRRGGRGPRGRAVGSHDLPETARHSLQPDVDLDCNDEQVHRIHMAQSGPNDSLSLNTTASTPTMSWSSVVVTPATAPLRSRPNDSIAPKVLTSHVLTTTTPWASSWTVLTKSQSRAATERSALSSKPACADFATVSDRPPSEILGPPTSTSTGVSALAHMQPQLQQQQHKRRDFAKLRDRWWEALRQRPPPSPPVVDVQAPRDEPATTLVSSTRQRNEEMNPPSMAFEPHQGDELNHKTNDDHANDPDLINPLLDEHNPYPLQEAIRNHDIAGLQRLLQRDPKLIHRLWQTPSYIMTPAQLAVHLKRPQMLRILLDSTQRDQGLLSTNNDFLAPIMMAAQRGDEEILQLIISNQGPASLLAKDSMDNHVLHLLCGKSGRASTFLALLKMSGNHQAKLLLSRNTRQQTPLHLACQNRRADLVEIILNVGSFTVLSKMLVMSDHQNQTPLLAAIGSGSTEIVMILLMWKGNNHVSHVWISPSTSRPCPLSWAVRSKSVPMVVQILEFLDPSSGVGLHLNPALRFAVELRGQNQGNNQVKEDSALLQMVRLLVESGANPCSCDSADDRPSAITLATQQHDRECLITLVDTYRLALKRLQAARRRDPMLSKQSESFFAGMEARESGEFQQAIRDALVACLYWGWKDTEKSELFHDNALALYGCNATLGEADVARLVDSLAMGSLLSRTENTKSDEDDPLIVFVVSYPRPTGPIRSEKETDDALAYWSRVMFRLPWFHHMAEESVCAWMRSADLPGDHESPAPDLCLVADDGTKFVAHCALVCSQSEKLAAAFSFYSVSQDGNGALIEMCVNISARACLLLLEHMYHGSMMSTLSRSDSDEWGRELLDLLWMAEEFLCRSLVQECEARLLSSDPRLCCCWSCAPARQRNKLSAPAVDCFYTVQGPSAVVSSATALDVLAVADHLAESGWAAQQREQASSDYALVGATVQSSTALLSPWTITTGPGTVRFRPLEALRQVAARCILQDWRGVIQSPMWPPSHAETDDVGEDSRGDGSGPSAGSKGGDEKEERRWLLRLCLEQLLHGIWPRRSWTAGVSTTIPAGSHSSRSDKRSRS